VIGRAQVSVAAALATLSIAAIAPARAQDEPEPEADAAYRAVLAEAVTEYGGGRYEEALALFRRAHDLRPNARTLRGIGMAAFEAREYVLARESLRAALEDAREPLTEEQRAHAEQLIGRTDAFIGRYALRATPSEVSIRVDGRPTVLDVNGELLLDVGNHSIVIEAPGHGPRTLELPVLGGERQELTVELTPVEGPTPAPDPGGAGIQPVTAEPVPPPTVTRFRRGVVPAGAGLLGGGAACLVTALLTGVFALRARSELEDRCPERICAEQTRSTADRAHRLAISTDVLWATGAAAAAAGVIVLLTGRERVPAPSASCVPGGCSLELSGAF
jgi:hypothetical protein